MAISKLDPDKEIVLCPFCSYFEIWFKESTSNFFYCKLDRCRKGSCTICRKEFKLPKSETSITAEEEKQMLGEDGMLSHFKCNEYIDLKSEWDKAIIIGNHRFCPECGGLGKIKNDACTQIKCAKCNCRYCYICEVAEKNCDKSFKKMC